MINLLTFKTTIHPKALPSNQVQVDMMNHSNHTPAILGAAQPPNAGAAVVDAKRLPSPRTLAEL